ncbi:5-oxoprolinase subunit PxpB [Blastochloris viridis]|uniref:Allophanate hydrolase 2 subunit 1 n=1 Tax=Blastochloris viridis TaxID=1079 RepID=A0A0H5BG22_BLAVI|nr:5-oxoprolinase subunit PxpB [Blastochloris viridis]ALK10022.1 Kinase A inhibitor [Blastochloris viridis]BAS00060.1 allophanate hydrolase 2 subunit 1 [Blastochloris viridis]CUU42686.1 Sporulation inhibitor kipI [Blastochloris viridis]
MRFLPAGDSALVVELGDAIDAAVGIRVARFATVVAAQHLDGITEVVPTFRSFLVCYDPLATCQARLISDIEALALSDPAPAQPPRRWTLPVCYAAECAPDLAEVAKSSRLSESEVVRRHTGATYHVYMLGFLPGFAYLGDLDPALRLPRRATPRTRLPTGSVAIAQAMTAIYPVESPGGWHLIGHTPVKMFDIAADPPALLAPGDAVRFTAISRDDCGAIADAVAAGRFRLEPERMA